ncbi:MAG: hypothetical protein ACXVAX_13260 [Pseudobdellovibrio sp.]
MSRILKCLLAILFLFYAEVSLAEMQRGTFKSTKIGLTSDNYTGADKLSFASGSPGYGAEISIDAGSSYYRYFFKARFSQSLGYQNFIANKVTYATNYNFVTVAPEIGVSLYPVQRKEHGLNIYLWGVGNVSYDYLELQKVPSTVKVDSKEQSWALGYGAGIGFELIMATTKDGKRLMLYSEVGFRESSVDLTGNSGFEVGGLTASVGFGF